MLFLTDDSKTRLTWQLSARMTPIRASNVGPPGYQDQGFHRCQPFRRLVLGLG
jgi:hypothetical protein